MLLRLTQLFVSQQTRKKLSTVGRSHRRHHRKFLLTAEVGAVKLVVRHAEQPYDLVRHRMVAIGDRSRAAILKQLCPVETAHDAIFVRAECKIDFDADRGPGRGTDATERFPAPSGGGVAVHRPRESL